MKKNIFYYLTFADISNPKEEWLSYFEDLHDSLDKLPRTLKIFIIGWFNSRMGINPIPDLMQKFNDDYVTDDVIINSIIGYKNTSQSNPRRQNTTRYKCRDATWFSNMQKLSKRWNTEEKNNIFYHLFPLWKLRKR